MDATFMIGRTGLAGATIEIGEVGAIVRGLRRARNLTLAQLAARCGYSVSTLSRMERGKQPLRDVAVLRNLAEALNIPPQVFLLADARRRSNHRQIPLGSTTLLLRPTRRPTRCVVARCSPD